MRYRVPAVLTLALTAALGLGACSDDDVDAGGGATTAAESPTSEAEAPEAPAETTGTTAEADPAVDATVAVADTDLGPVLVDADGMTLYLFTNDAGGESACYDQCAATWPALVAETPTAGEGADTELLGTTARDDGTTQVTYNGHPLYYFANDAAPGDTNGQGVGDVWFAVDASGEPVTG
jgi:predicted lipoprotein with Yx(FWY)xxD motif